MRNFLFLFRFKSDDEDLDFIARGKKSGRVSWLLFNISKKLDEFSNAHMTLITSILITEKVIFICRLILCNVGIKSTLQ